MPRRGRRRMVGRTEQLDQEKREQELRDQLRVLRIEWRQQTHEPVDDFDCDEAPGQ